jgi:hypothetical protein
MIFQISSLSALRMMLSSAAMAERAAAPAEFVTDEDGTLHVRAGGRTSANLARELAPFGVSIEKGNDFPPGEVHAVSCWWQMLPLERREVSAGELASRPLLFEARETADAARLSAEVLRLGNDRQAFARVGTANGERTFLRVVGPPYYSVLQAVDAEGLTAYAEGSPGVWVKLGWTHPMADRIAPAVGEILLLAPPAEWKTLSIPQFADLYDIATITLPSAAGKMRSEDVEPFDVPLRLQHVGGDDAAELWVLRERGIEQLEDFVASSDDELLSRLAFAVVEDAGARSVLVRTRPGRGTPPVLVFEGLALRPYLKLNHLFVPCGMRIHPPVRRDVLQRLLADDPEQVSWLEPVGTNSFRARRVADDAFRPLTDWVDYVLDYDRESLTAWSDSFQFEFDAYVVDDPMPRERTSRPPTENHKKPSAEQVSSVNAEKPPPRPPEAAVPAAPKPSPVPAPIPALRPAPAIDLDAVLAELQALESQFLQAEGGFDAPSRTPLWMRMARLHDILGSPADASACWQAALWTTDRPTVEDVAVWRQTVMRLADLDPSLPPTSDQLQAIAREPLPAPSRTLVLAAALIEADVSGLPLPCEAGPLVGCLERHDGLLPIRAAWMAWRAAATLTGGDQLALARTRDRLLERLHRQGLSPQLDFPAFLRVAGRRAGERSQRVRSTLLQFAVDARQWLERETQAANTGIFKLDPNARSAAYANLQFAWGLAVVGELDASRALLDSGTAALVDGDAVHQWLLEAFSARIEAARRGQTADPLPEALLARLEVDPLRTLTVGSHKIRAVFLIDQFRRQSRILEPAETIDAFRWGRTESPDPLVRSVAALATISDPDQCIAAARGHLAAILSPETATASRWPAFRGLLNLAPRLGSSFAAELLPHVSSLLDSAPDAAQEIAALEKGLAAATHFEQLQFVHPFVERTLSRFERLLTTKRNPQDLAPLASLLGQSTRVLRRLGLHDVARELAHRAAEQIATTEEKAERDAASSQKAKRAPDEPATTIERQIVSLVLLLRFVPSFVHFGEHDRVQSLFNRAETILFPSTAGDVDARPVYRQLLVRTWCEAAATLDVDLAVPRLSRVFRELRGVHRPSSTDTHYSAALLSVVDAVVLAMTHEDLSIDPAQRRLLDDAEFIVRRRIHEDVRRAGLRD